MLKLILIVAWSIPAAYLGVVSWNATTIYKLASQPDPQGLSYEYPFTTESGKEMTINFANRGEAMEFRRQQLWEREQYGELVFDWMPISWVPIAGPVIFGLIGGVLGLIRRIAFTKDLEINVPLIIHPLVGMIVGVLVFIFTMLVPKAFIAHDTTPTWYAVVMLSAFGGFFAETALSFFDKQAKKIFGDAPRARTTAS